MKSRPILFSGPMVRAILEGRKTQTRRIAKAFNMPQFDATEVHKIGKNSFIGWSSVKNAPPIEFTKNQYKESDGINSPYGNVGDQLWVRETFQYVDYDHIGYVYRATDPDWESMEAWTWKPSIFMPCDASRITLEITDICCEKLTTISESDAIAEGVEQWPDGNYKHYGTTPGKYTFARSSYISLWDQINGEGSWEQNPFVWVIEFKVL